MTYTQCDYPNGSICFTTQRLTIREFSQNYLEALLAYESQPGMLQYEAGIPDAETAEQYLRTALQCAREESRTKYHLAVTLSSTDQVIGRIILTSQNPSINEWEIGWAIRMNDWGKGYAPEAARKMLKFAFQVLQAHRVVAFCHAGNTKSASVMEKIGMIKEGHLRQTRWFRENWADEFIYAILDKDNWKMPVDEATIDSPN